MWILYIKPTSNPTHCKFKFLITTIIQLTMFKKNIIYAGWIRVDIRGTNRNCHPYLWDNVYNIYVRSCNKIWAVINWIWMPSNCPYWLFALLRSYYGYFNMYFNHIDSIVFMDWTLRSWDCLTMPSSMTTSHHNPKSSSPRINLLLMSFKPNIQRWPC